ncbi:MAG: hypothetical protein AAF371_00500 [Pseudomonadota bacterium]
MTRFLGALTARLIGIAALASASTAYLGNELILRGYGFNWDQFRDALIQLSAIAILVPVFLVPAATRWLFQRQAMREFVLPRLGPLMLILFAGIVAGYRMPFHREYWFAIWGVLGVLYFFFFVAPGRYARAVAADAVTEERDDVGATETWDSVGRQGHGADWRDLDSLKPRPLPERRDTAPAAGRAVKPRPHALAYLCLLLLALVLLLAGLGLWALVAPRFMPTAEWAAQVDRLALPLGLGLSLLFGVVFTAMPRFSRRAPWLVRRCGPVFGHQIRFLGATVAAFLLLAQTVGPALAVGAPHLHALFLAKDYGTKPAEIVVATIEEAREGTLTLARCPGWAEVRRPGGPSIPACLGDAGDGSGTFLLSGNATSLGLLYDRVSGASGS